MIFKKKETSSKLRHITKTALTWLFAIFFCSSAAFVLADEWDIPAFIHSASISDIQFYEDGSLKSFQAAVTPAAGDDYNQYFTPATSNGAIALHTEKFGTMNAVPPTGGMQYYLYNGPTIHEYGYIGDEYHWHDIKEEQYPGYWEHHLYKDFACLEKGTMNSSRPILDLTWEKTGTGKPEECYFVTWCQDANGNSSFPLTIANHGENRVTTTKTCVFPKGMIIPGEKQTYYMYLWNQWANTYPIQNEWWNPDGIYPDRLLFTLDTSKGLSFGIIGENGDIANDGVFDSVTLSGGNQIGDVLTANLTDKDGQDACSHWSKYQWFSDGRLVATDTLNYTLQASDMGKEISFICEAATNSGRIGILKASKMLPAAATTFSLPTTGDDTSLVLSATLLLFSIFGLAWLGKRQTA